MKNWKIGITVVLTLLIAGLFWGLINMRIDWLQSIMVIFTAYGIFMIFIAATLKPKKFLVDYDYKPFVTLVIPARNEEFVIQKTIRSLMKLNYLKDNKPNFEVIVMDDNSSDNTLSKSRGLMKEYQNLRVINRTPDVAGKGKSDVLNHAVREAKGDIIGVFDADTKVDPDFLIHSVALLADPKVGGVQGRVRLYNRNTNILTQLQDDEFSIISHLYQLGKEMVNGLTALGGNGQLVKREALDQVDGWNYMSPTEDLDLTFKLLFKGWEVRYTPKSVLWQEGVEKPYPFIRQRVRWAEGFLKCIFDYTIPLLTGKYDIMKKLDGVMTMGRILIPFYVWIGYIYFFMAIINGLEIGPGLSSTLIIASSWCFIASLTVGMMRVYYSNPLVALGRVFLYSIYGALWIFAIPIGFVNCIRNIDDIKWDKTVHNGSNSDIGKAMLA